MEFTKKGSIENKIRNKMSRFYQGGDRYIDEDFPFKRACLQGEKDENIFVTSDHIIFKRKFLHVVKRLWQEIDDRDRYFVV